MANRKLGKYEIIDRLGRGGMAEVYRGYHPSLDRYVAIKVLHAFLADDPEFKDRFEREAQNVAKLKHPHIVQVYDFEYDETGESYYMVMELVDGQTLKDRLTELEAQGKPLSLAEAVRIVREAAGALAYAHRMNMIHRDVKPANLMLDHDDRLVLTDFGIAKIVTGAQFTQSGGMVGTPAYMAPEQGLGDAGDERSDLYSLGVILYQLTTGHLPYDAETPLATILKHLNSPIPSIRDINANLPEAVDLIIAKAMAKAKEERYQTAAEFIADLDMLDLSNDGRQTSLTTPVRLKVQSQGPVVPSPVKKSADSDEETMRLNQEPGKLASSTARPNPRILRWILGAAAAGIIIAGVYVVGARNGTFPMIGLAPSATPTLTATATSSVTPEPTATDTPPTATPTESATPTVTITPSETPTSTPSITPSHTSTTSPTPTASATATQTQTVTRTPSVTPTPSVTNTPSVTPTPSPDITQTLAQSTQISVIQTATTAACDFDYEVIEQQPPDSDYFQANQSYVRQIVLLNTGVCPWERNTSLTFVSGEDFDAPPRIFIRDRVNVGEEVTVEFSGRTPQTNGLLTGVWELRTPGQLLIGNQLEISVNVFGG